MSKVRVYNHTPGPLTMTAEGHQAPGSDWWEGEADDTTREVITRWDLLEADVPEEATPEVPADPPAAPEPVEDIPAPQVPAGDAEPEVTSSTDQPSEEAAQ